MQEVLGMHDHSPECFGVGAAGGGKTQTLAFSPDAYQNQPQYGGQQQDMVFSSGRKQQMQVGFGNAYGNGGMDMHMPMHGGAACKCQDCKELTSKVISQALSAIGAGGDSKMMF